MLIADRLLWLSGQEVEAHHQQDRYGHRTHEQIEGCCIGSHHPPGDHEHRYFHCRAGAMKEQQQCQLAAIANSRMLCRITCSVWYSLPEAHSLGKSKRTISNREMPAA